jgi:hypothetical protein
MLTLEAEKWRLSMFVLLIIAKTPLDRFRTFGTLVSLAVKVLFTQSARLSWRCRNQSELSALSGVCEPLPGIMRRALEEPEDFARDAQSVCDKINTPNND